MFNVSCRILNDTGDAEDVLQEAFISAFKNLNSFKGDASFGAWLKRIVINKSLNLIKKRQIDLVSVDTLPEVPIDSEYSEFSETSLSVEKIKEAVKQLPDGYRVVFTMYLFEGYDHAEIAEFLGISESTSKSQFNRSKKKLKEILEAGNDE